MSKVCAFSGHRNLNYGLDYNSLDEAVEKLIKEGTTEFLCGMAFGFDLVAAECVIYFKNKYDIKLTAVIPCADQTNTFPSGAKKKYDEILKRCDRVITLAPRYYNGCMLERNRYMVDNSDALICYLRTPRGGTFYTVNYARKQGKKIIEV